MTGYEIRFEDAERCMEQYGILMFKDEDEMIGYLENRGYYCVKKKKKSEV